MVGDAEVEEILPFHLAQVVQLQDLILRKYGAKAAKAGGEEPLVDGAVRHPLHLPR